MKRLLLVLFAVGIVGCGTHSSTPKCPTPAYAGCASQKVKAAGPPTAGVRFADISEYQGCPAFVGPVIFKVYEGGYGQDHSALCNARRARGHWAGVYAFLRPTNCAGQGYATAQIVKQIGGVSGPVVADAEVPLPAGCVDQFLRSVRAGLGGPTDIYTSPGTWPGGALSAPLWVATYGPRPGCVGTCSHVAWQFTDAGSCSGLTNVDCSFDSGILHQVRVDQRGKLYAAYRLRNQLRHLLTKYRCRVAHPQVHNRVCRYWRNRGNVVNVEIERLHQEGVF